MHQIKVACILRHYHDNPWHENMLRRLCAEQLLLASSTTEGNSGGNVRSSEAPIERQGEGQGEDYGGRISLVRRATVMSYGAEADGIVTTARRSADSPASDQVLVVFLKNDYSLERLSSWDTLGMRGTCSTGYVIRASGEPGQVLPDAYEKIHAETMLPFAHLSWSSAWTGIAAGAVERAQLFLRHAARQNGGQLPPGAAHFTRASASLRTLRGVVASALRNFEQIQHDGRALRSIDFQSAINMTKVEASELAVSIVLGALRAAGLSGYRNDSEFSVVRNLRDVLSAPIMINNDRILGNLATPILMAAIPPSLLD
jgi:acyl-CoA dehydrogenase